MSLYGFLKNKVNYIDIMLIVALGVIATIVPFLSHFLIFLQMVSIILPVFNLLQIH